MRFSPSFLDNIRNRLTLSAVLGRKLAWDRRKSNPGRGDYWACCPFHNEKTASFHVDDHSGRYHCFGCKKSGDIFTFLVEKEGASFPEAVEQLAQEAGLALPQRSQADVEHEKIRSNLYEVMEIANRFFQEQLHSSQGAKARSYLTHRLIPPDIQQQFHLGYAPDDRAQLRNHLASKNIPLDQMIEAGLLVSGDDIPVAYDRFRDRLMFPIFDVRGRTIAFGGRALKAEAPAKYLNSPETPLFHKGLQLYNLNQARSPAHQQASIIAVEGYIDVIALTRAGFPQTVAPLGTALTPDQLALMWKYAPEPTLCFDGDAAGQKAAYRALDLCLPLLKPGYSIKIALLPANQDPDDLLKSDGPNAIKAVLEQAVPLSTMLWQRAWEENDRSTPERKARFEQDIRRLSQQITDETVKRHYLDEFNARLQNLRKNQRVTQNIKPFRGPQLFIRSWKKPSNPWELQSPVSAQLRALASSETSHSALARREGMVLLAFINHPSLIDEFLDLLSTTEFGSPPLDELRQKIINTAALEQNLETASFKRHLKDQGHGSLLNQLENQASRLNEWYLGSGAATDDARTGLRQMFALHHKTITLDREVRAAEAAFIADPTEEKFKALTGLREQLLSASGSEAQIAGFGAASGRVVDPLT